MTTFSDLPPEMKLYILSFFNPRELNDKVAKICRNWRFLCADPFIWRTLEIDGDQRTSEQIINVLNRNQYVRHLQLNYVENFSSIISLQKHTAVQSIHFTDCTLSESDVLPLINIFPNVENINIDCCEDFGQEAMLEVSQWQFLRSFALRGYDHGGDLSTCIPLFVEKTKLLEELDLGELADIDIGALNRLIEIRGKCFKILRMFGVLLQGQNCQLFATTCVNLKELHLDWPVMMFGRDLSLILKKLPSLEILRLSYGVRLFSAHFPCIFRDAQFPRLTELIIECCENLDEKCLNAFVKCCPNLTDLKVANMKVISEEQLRKLSTFCRNLELLIFSHVERITVNCLDDIVSGLPKLCYCLVTKCPLIYNGGLYRVVDKPKSRMLGRNRWMWHRDEKYYSRYHVKFSWVESIHKFGFLALLFLGKMVRIIKPKTFRLVDHF